MDEVIDVKNVERRTEHEKLCLGIFLTIITLSTKGSKEAGAGMSDSIPSSVLPHPPAKLSVSLTFVLISCNFLDPEARSHFEHCPSQI